MRDRVIDTVADFARILLFLNLPKTQKSKYLENKSLLFL